MPRIKTTPTSVTKHYPEFVAELANELRSKNQFGQPRIEETEFASGAVRVSVIWDKWERVADSERTDIILRAYEEVEGKAYRDRITLAIGLTVPEAREMGILVARIEPPPSTPPELLERCAKTMRALGASDLFASRVPELWLASKDEAEAARSKLRKELPEVEWLMSWDFVDKSN